MTLRLGPPGGGNTTSLLALAAPLKTGLKREGTIEYNGHKLNEFEPRKPAIYVRRNASEKRAEHIMTTRSCCALLLSLLYLVLLVAGDYVPATNVTSAEKIDTHTHFVPPFYYELLKSRNITSGGHPIPYWNASNHLAVNQKFGIRTSILSISTPGAKLSANDSIEDGRTLARQLNEYGWNLTVEYPHKFLFFATLTLPDLDGAVAEAEYALDNLSAAGVILKASAFGEQLGTPRYAPLYKVLNDRKAVVFVHPSNSPCAEDPVESANSTDLPPYVVDFLLDTTRAALNLVYRNVTQDYPDISWILAHSGGFLPFAATRGAGGLTLLSNQPGGINIYLGELKKFHVDLAISASPTALPSTFSFFSDTQVTFGSDYPYASEYAISYNLAGFQNYHLSNGTRRRINFRNAQRLFFEFLKY